MLRLQSTISSWREYLSPVSHISNFKQTGEITPEEFVLAGDYLVYKFPTWAWSSAAPSKQRDFLPPDKQFLVTKHVACHVRAQASSGAYQPAAGSARPDESEEEVENGWTISFTSSAATAQTAPISSSSGTSPSADGSPAAVADEDEDLILDIDDMDDELADSGYLANPTTESGNSATSLPDRSYNLYITYSTSYRVPKMYLSGFNASGSPLTPQEMFEDIVSEYKDKTVTIEASPFLDNITMVSIHPCRHASVMKMLFFRAEERQRRLLSQGNAKPVTDVDDLLHGVEGLGLVSDEWESITTENLEKDSEEQDAIRVDQYLVIFLKFISSVTPGIEHDNTMTAL
ncbi:autophagocytosis associated protein [Lipomyces oligophaga]|uniref:autophagocytosis associated protein n=1 Tax=Lipomyces oligophaga TaxID=45792 RepID=UPI0034CEB99B